MRGGGGVRVGVGPAPDRSGEHTSGHRPVLHRDEGLRARADESVDRADPGVRVSGGERADESPQVGARGDGALEVAREDDLAELAVRDARQRTPHGVLVALGALRSGAHGARPMRSVLRGLDGTRRTLVVGAVDAGLPEAVAVAAEDPRRDDEHAVGARVLVEGEGPERDESGPGESQRVGDLGRRREPLPERREGLGAGAPLLGRRAELGDRLTHRHDPVAAAEPGERAGGVREGEEVFDRIDLSGLHDQGGVLHDSSLFRGRRVGG